MPTTPTSSLAPRSSLAALAASAPSRSVAERERSMLDAPQASLMSRLSLLVDLASLLAREVDFDALLQTACEQLARALRADRASIWLVDSEAGDLFTRVAVLPELPSLRQPMGRGLVGFVAQSGQTLRLDDVQHDERFDPTADRATGYTTRSMLVAPIREEDAGPVRGVVQVLNREGGPFDAEDELYLLALATQLGRALKLTTLRGGGAPGVVLRGPFNRIVGRSEALTRVYERIALAAQTDATVLLRGETGTGKGLFARAIHVNSARQSRPFVTVDCTTLPSQLVESELFGHERGAFTGADRRVPGKVELAEGGTLFLDELGDLPLEAQGKLLRFLQDRVFERVGGRTTLSADVRIVAATHRDLEREVKRGSFRQDLYYRIKVVEIAIPPLRARGGDEIVELARHFAHVFATRYRRPEPELEPEAVELLRSHDWPGNVRELEHWIESALALSPDGRVRADMLPVPRVRAPESSRSSSARPPPPPRGVEIPLELSLDDAMRRYVEATLDACEGNRSEAAKRLGVGRNSITRWLKRQS